jgi:hypothetical protein
MLAATMPAMHDLDCRLSEWGCTPALDSQQFEAMRRRMVLDCCKWDPQVGDVSTLAPFAIVLPAAVWRQLAGLAERLTVEAFRAEEELLSRPELLGRLGLPGALRDVLANWSLPPTATVARVVRFDFHPTATGWRISEANTDVPGGYTEAVNLPRLMAGHFPDLQPAAGEPAAELVAALARCGRRIALLCAAGYVEDQQVVAYLAARLRALGCTAHVGHPRQVCWRSSVAHVRLTEYCGAVDAVFRFYQGEWLGHLPASTGWPAYLRGGETPVCNPGTALLTESKRFPLTWERLKTPLPTWRRLLPETGDPRAVRWQHDPGWLLKTAFCNTGDTVAIRELMGAWRWRWLEWQVRLRPGQWVAQRRFEPLPLATPVGPRYLCLGVYTVNGRAAGIYGRMAPRPLIDFAAVDVAVLVRPDAPAGGAE